MKSIVIKSLKDIKNLEFTIPEHNGVYLIAGANGIGKTTLLVCLDRVCNKLAFPSGFSSTSSWSSADQYINSSIKYEADGNSVIYKKAKSRWSPTPKRNSAEVLNGFGFSSSVFIREDSKRIDIKQDDLRSGNLTSVDEQIKRSLNQIFETSKYNHLLRLKNTNGRGRGAVYFYVIREGSGSHIRYYSEKRFSTGELAIVRLVEQVENASENTMILLDEAELALHPRVQVKLLHYLREKASTKSLWIFVSTHSPTILKAASKEEIILLRKENDITEVITPCYPAQAIGDIDFANSNIFDYIFFVEDEMAQAIVKYMRERYVQEKNEHATALCNIIPVGGFYETARLAVSTNTRVFGDTKVFAIVDQDAVDDLDKKPKSKRLYESNRDLIKTLSFTPEVWLIEKLENYTASLNRKFLDAFQIEISSILSDANYSGCNATNERQKAKDKFKVVIKKICASSGLCEELANNDIIHIIIQDVPLGNIMRVMNPLFR